MMVVLVFTNVVLRYGFNSGADGLGGTLALAVRLDDLPGSLHRPRDHSHLGTDTLVARLPVTGRRSASRWPMC